MLNGSDSVFLSFFLSSFFVRLLGEPEREPVDLGLPVLVGASRKSFIGQVHEGGNEERGRLGGSIAAACVAMLHGASIKNDRNHGAAKGSSGAIMGSKRLKAVAVRGTGRIPLADPDAFVELTERWQKVIDAGFSGMLEKPIQPDVLEETIKRALYEQI